MSPDSSASGMNFSGEIDPCSGCCQRNNASRLARYFFYQQWAENVRIVDCFLWRYVNK